MAIDEEWRKEEKWLRAIYEDTVRQAAHVFTMASDEAWIRILKEYANDSTITRA